MWNIIKFLEIEEEGTIHNIELDYTIIWYNIGIIILLGIIIVLILEIIELKLKHKEQIRKFNSKE